uniref:Uncharacterized protein n=2 Tax=Vibrionaceae TaxID=641 RepID=A0A0H3ZQ39_ALIFS|nr:hypothetical protein [Vibrio tasmaniensis]AKN38478.1 hypothetical protein [Aliivibrio fischeri]
MDFEAWNRLIKTVPVSLIDGGRLACESRQEEKLVFLVEPYAVRVLNAFSLL